MKKLIILGFALATFACSNKAAEEAEKVKKETFALHDEVMPLTMQLGDLKDSLGKIATTDSTLKSQILDASTTITKADEQMMTWMEELGKADEIQNAEEKIKKLTELKAQGEEIKKLTNEAKQKAEAVFKK